MIGEYMNSTNILQRLWFSFCIVSLLAIVVVAVADAAPLVPPDKQASSPPHHISSKRCPKGYMKNIKGVCVIKYTKEQIMKGDEKVKKGYANYTQEDLDSASKREGK